MLRKYEEDYNNGDLFGVYGWARLPENRKSRWIQKGGDLIAAQNLWDSHLPDEKTQMIEEGFRRPEENPYKEL